MHMFARQLGDITANHPRKAVQKEMACRMHSANQAAPISVDFRLTRSIDIEPNGV